jgi:hypothetical protein
VCAKQIQVLQEDILLFPVAANRQTMAIRATYLGNSVEVKGGWVYPFTGETKQLLVLYVYAYQDARK